MHRGISTLVRRPSLAGFRSLRLAALLAALAALMAPYARAATAASKTQRLAAVPPMGWNDWAHYQCGFTGETILNNARMLVKTGLAARGYNTVTIDDCWMLKTRDAQGNLQADPGRFPQGMKPLADAIHRLGLKFGIYEDAGSETCGEFAGSGQPQGGGKDHFLQDARLFASWGVDYLKLDGCNVYARTPEGKVEAYRKAYAAQSEALKSAGKPIVFSESAPAYFQDTPAWYDVLAWVRQYGQLWREGTDMANYHAKSAGKPRFKSVLWNYAYNLPLGRFQSPGNWNDPDFIIGGDSGLSLAESRSQMALWSMMSAPLILSSDIERLNPEAIEILGNRAVIAVDQDPLGRMATLVRRTAAVDLLLKPLKGAEYAVAVLNHGESPAHVRLEPAELGFAGGARCTVDAQDLWSGAHATSLAALQADVASHDTAIWRIRPSAACGKPARTGTIVMTAGRSLESLPGYTRCLASSAELEECAGGPQERWTVTAGGGLRSAAGCLAAVGGKPVLQKCNGGAAQKWRYTLSGNLVNAGDKECLTNGTAVETGQPLSMQSCGHNQANQIWSLPN